jgi:hypothetical protein
VALSVTSSQEGQYSPFVQAARGVADLFCTCENSYGDHSPLPVRVKPEGCQSGSYLFFFDTSAIDRQAIVRSVIPDNKEVSRPDDFNILGFNNLADPGADLAGPGLAFAAGKYILKTL